MEDMEDIALEPSEEGTSMTCPCCGEKISVSLAKSAEDDELEGEYEEEGMEDVEEEAPAEKMDKTKMALDFYE